MDQNEWSKPVSSPLISAAKLGIWNVYLTPNPLPKHWLGNVKGKKILCLASAGGHQAPILAAAGAKVVVFDLSEEQLKHDVKVAQRDGLYLETIHGDIIDLKVFANE